MTSKSGLAIILSRLHDFRVHNIALEQYSTPSEIAADLLWNAYLLGDIKGKVILDAACGPGFLGIGALILGAKGVFFVDISSDAIGLCKENCEEIANTHCIYGKKVFLQEDIVEFGETVDTVLQNPPFGVQKKHADRVFMDTALNVGGVVYTLHKKESRAFIEARGKEAGFVMTHLWPYVFSIGATQSFHKKERYVFDAACFRLKKSLP
ncbi:RsmD family RNA methyltransferase [Candidatus Woesearchaeota archaeon]|nr:RsmD family RNA methyltransferase [Candidatus Woesearchaeota archaeon]